MTRQLWFEMLDKWLLLDFILLAFSYGLSWIIIFQLGFKILKVDMQFQRIIPGVICGIVITFLKPFLPGILYFLTILIPLIIYLKFYGKTKWVIACWIAVLLLLFTTIGPMLLISPFSKDRAIISFLFETRYGTMLGTLIECLIPAVLLVLLKIYNFSLIPSPGKLLNIMDFFDIYLFGALLFWCYDSFLKIWEAVRNSPQQLLFKPVSVWIVSAGAILAFYIKKVNSQKKMEYALKKIQELDAFNKDLNEKNLKLEQYKEIVNTFTFMSQSPAVSTDSTGEPGKVSKRYELPQIKITKRELSVIELIVGGKSNKEIADFLALSEGRVRNIITKIFGKLNLQDRTQVAVYALDNNLVKRDCTNSPSSI